MLSEAFDDGVDVTLIDKGDTFTFGYSKLDVMFGRTTLDAVGLPYKEFVKPGVRFLQETIASIDPVAKRVTTDRGTHEADSAILIMAMGRKVGRVTPCAPFARRRPRTGAHGVTRPTNLAK
jgi:sulfide:quinone oxidoreductase